MNPITSQSLMRLFPRLAQRGAGAVAEVAIALTDACAEFSIAGWHLAAFLAQAAHESAEFAARRENMNYSAERIVAVWPKRFPTREDALPYAHDPESLASHVYANRNGNGDEASGDGWIYRGGGYFQLTGRGNYRRCGIAIGINLEGHPERIVEPRIAARSAAWFWTVPAHAHDTTNFVSITRRINGGLNGLADRRRHLERVLAELGKGGGE